MYLKRFLLVAIAAVMSFGFLGACGGNQNTQTEETPVEETAPATTSEETPAGEMTEEAEEATEAETTEETPAEEAAEGEETEESAEEEAAEETTETKGEGTAPAGN